MDLEKEVAGLKELILEQDNALKEYKQNIAKATSELTNRIVRLEKKEAESYIKNQMIPELYLSIEDCKHKMMRLTEEVERYRIQQQIK
ncbi:hypothetical protein ACR77J_09460 [Tissierella praeacuta]|uniref:hypothetical protein n=1 Tax=Tissierella praeacuta TaxID=43131 RepID=UPI003DA3C0D5